MNTMAFVPLVLFLRDHVVKKEARVYWKL